MGYTKNWLFLLSDGFSQSRSYIGWISPSDHGSCYILQFGGRFLVKSASVVYLTEWPSYSSLWPELYWTSHHRSVYIHYLPTGVYAWYTTSFYFDLPTHYSIYNTKSTKSYFKHSCGLNKEVVTQGTLLMWALLLHVPESTEQEVPTESKYIVRVNSESRKLKLSQDGLHTTNSLL